MAVAKARKKGIIDFFNFSQPEDETVLWGRQILKLNTYSSPETRALDQGRRSLLGRIVLGSVVHQKPCVPSSVPNTAIVATIVVVWEQASMPASRA